MAGFNFSDFDFYDIQTRPGVGDIVWSKWPKRETPAKPGPWTRPALIVHVQLLEVELIEGQPKSKTIYAAITAQYGGDYESTDISKNLLIRTDEFRALGLHKPTVFRMDTKNRRRLPWCKQFFISQGYVRNQKLVAGKLNANQIQRMEACFLLRGLTFPIPNS